MHNLIQNIAFPNSIFVLISSSAKDINGTTSPLRINVLRQFAFAQSPLSTHNVILTASASPIIATGRLLFIRHESTNWHSFPPIC